MNQPLVSLIVPVYKVEPYLRECLDSLIAQSYTNWEAICINDGSPDNSLAILEEYATNDPRFRVYSQDNKGLGAARNVGFRHAKGEWVLCVDSDDFLAPEALSEALRKETDDVDVIMIGMRPVGDEDEIRRRSMKPVSYAFKKRPYVEHLSQTFETCYIWMRMVRGSLFKKYRLFCDENVSMWEDVGFSLRLAAVARNVTCVTKCLYCYRIRMDSLVGSFVRNMSAYTICNLKLLRNSIDFYEQHGLMDKMAPHLPYFFTALVNFYLAAAANNKRHLAFDFICEMESRFKHRYKLYETRTICD